LSIILRSAVAERFALASSRRDGPIHLWPAREDGPKLERPSLPSVNLLRFLL